jgi:hypothetical protein
MARQWAHSKYFQYIVFIQFWAHPNNLEDISTGPIHILRLHLPHGPMWVFPYFSVYLHMGFYEAIAYISRHYVDVIILLLHIKELFLFFFF